MSCCFSLAARHRIRQLLGRVVRVSHELRAQPGGARSQRAIAHQHSGIAGERHSSSRRPVTLPRMPMGSVSPL